MGRAGPAKRFAKLKHVELKMNYVMEGIDPTEIKLKTFSWQEMLADNLTITVEKNEFRDALKKADLFRLLPRT